MDITAIVDDLHARFEQAHPEAGPYALSEYRSKMRRALEDLRASGYAVVPEGRPEHVVEFTEDAWAIEHPLPCRSEFASLHDCTTHAAVAADIDLNGRPAGPLGRYRAVVRDGKVRAYEFVS